MVSVKSDTRMDLYKDVLVFWLPLGKGKMMVSSQKMLSYQWVFIVNC